MRMRLHISMRRTSPNPTSCCIIPVASILLRLVRKIKHKVLTERIVDVEVSLHSIQKVEVQVVKKINRLFAPQISTTNKIYIKTMS